MTTTPKWSDLVSLDRERTIAAANALLPAWVSLLIVILIGWQLATIVWMFVPGTDAGDPVAIPAGQGSIQRSTGGGDGRSSAQSISEASMFGKAEIVEGPAPEVPANDYGDVDETNLRNLKLKGTIASDRPEFSIAIISDGNNDEKIYAVGDPIISGTKLHAVEVTKVILNENGTLTSLSLPQEFTPTTSAAVRRRTPTRQVAQQSSSIQSVVAQNVSRLADVIRPTPYFVNGQQMGYRVYPGRDRRQFAALGLRPGDLIKEIDGQSLTDPTQAMQIFQSLGTAQQVSVTVERNGTPETIVLKTEQLDLGKGNVD
ncbi:MAG: type II secretion system protein GspC [Woeseiaceae bacterium]|nr:type II secretion system protein GspC [Woeseiaceae bacterium]